MRSIQIDSPTFEIVLHEKIEFDEGVCLVYAQLDEVTKTLRSAANIEGQSTYDSSLSMFEVDISCSIQDLVRDSATVSSQITLELQNFRTHVLDALRNLISAPSAPPSLTHTVTMQHTDSLDQESEEEINVGLIPDVVPVLVANVVLSNDVDRDDSHRDQYLQVLLGERNYKLLRGFFKVLSLVAFIEPSGSLIPSSPQFFFFFLVPYSQELEDALSLPYPIAANSFVNRAATQLERAIGEIHYNCLWQPSDQFAPHSKKKMQPDFSFRMEAKFKRLDILIVCTHALDKHIALLENVLYGEIEHDDGVCTLYDQIDELIKNLQSFRFIRGMLGAIKVLIDSPPSVPNLVSTIIDQNAEAHDHASKKEPSIDSQGGDDVDIRHEAINKDNGRSSIVEKKESVDKRDNTFQEFFTSAGVVIAEYDILKSVDKVTDGDGYRSMTPNEVATHTAEIISPSSNLFIPTCPEEAKPKVGMVFQSLEDEFNFYKQYAALAGFDIRESTNLKVSGVVVWRYIVCNREGHKHFASTCNKPTHDDGDLPKAKQRRRISNRVDCKTRVVFRLTGGVGYSISIFIESRNHPMMSLPSRPFLKINRNLEIGHQREDVPPYRWLFNRFLDAMGHAPQCIITDQDASRAIAIPEDSRGMVVNVEHSTLEGSFFYTCKNWQRIGLLCRHIFLLFKVLKIKLIPERYITNRWCKTPLLKPRIDVSGLDFTFESAIDKKKVMLNRLWSNIHSCVALIENNPELLCAFSKVITEQKEVIEFVVASQDVGTEQRDLFENYCGVPAPIQQ
ncbi:hypothetical protein DM860_013478 [Cuscuta australis]|uniref:SWIM-type domain-containing protein n=1 Tax=Cuscuta australis TaxID=267555 RepID=A0A328CZ84_9ASTE|nr:hypothetical protein DM860_013478 [Cuscuta australis]